MARREEKVRLKYMDAQIEGNPSNGPTWTKQIRQDGEFVRRDATFRDRVTAEGADGFAAESGRYHLYVSYACPWAHRTLITRKLKGLEPHVSVDVVDHLLPHGGWTLHGQSPRTAGDSVNGTRSLREVYELAAPNYQGAVTVPALWDKKKSTIANNESSEIIRMFNSEFQAFAEKPAVDLYPEELRAEIDEVNDWVYTQINNGVYRSGFARSQSAYDRAARDLFAGLDRAEAILSKRRYLAGNRLTEADVRLWTTLIRFDLVYVTHFKCNLRRLVDYPQLWDFTKELFSYREFRETTDFEHIKRHYYESHDSINPHRIVPIGPEIDFDQPHDRGRLPSEWSPE